LNASKALMEMLKGHDVSHVFGLPGETTLNWYREWHDYPEIRHVMARDERSAAFMADGYAKVSFKPGVCEGPSVGATHMIPGVAESYKASVPMVVFTTDTPLHLEKRNIFTNLDQTSLFRPVTKETITVLDASEIPHAVRRAFRLATTGRPGPVHVRLPSNVISAETEDRLIYSQSDFASYPGHRPTAEERKIVEALELLGSASQPVIICGQGVLHSQAWSEVQSLAEIYGIPVGTTISGKGSMPETHPLSIGVIGSRGGTSLSNRVVSEADAIFYIGCNTDSVATMKWTMPQSDTEVKIVHLDISEAEAGNNYPTDVILIGDAKATLQKMVEASIVDRGGYEEIPRIRAIQKEAKEYDAYISDLAGSGERPVHPLRFVKELSNAVPQDHTIVADVGISAIYTAAFFKVLNAGRSVLFNYAVGALGYALPASVGVHFARPESCTVALTGDGSFGFTAAELETINRVGGNINVILFNNGSFGWIKAEVSLSMGAQYSDFATNFEDTDYLKVAEGFGLTTFQAEEPSDLGPTLKEAFDLDGPTFTEIKVLPENELVPPVPGWMEKARRLGVRQIL